jgi:DNA-binding beta-propeller fold protein YncE
MKRIWLVIFDLTLAVSAGHAQGAAPLRLVQTISLPAVHGRIDHFDADLAHQRLLMSALGNNTLEVFDLRTDKLLRSISGLNEPQGVTYAARSNRVFVANGGDGTVRMFDGNTFTLLKTVHFSSDADDTRYDPATQQVIVGYGDDGNAGLGILDGETGNVLATIRLPGHPESFQLEASGPRIFVNIPSAGGVIDVVSRTARKVIATWTLDRAGANFPMALDEKDRRLFVTCRRPAEMLALDTQTGNVIARVPCAGDADDMWYDTARKRIYISGGRGLISVIGQQDVNHYRKIGEVATASGARTSQFVPSLNRLYLGVWGHGSAPEELRVYEILP